MIKKYHPKTIKEQESIYKYLREKEENEKKAAEEAYLSLCAELDIKNEKQQ